jgi:hypothetical protein
VTDIASAINLQDEFVRVKNLSDEPAYFTYLAKDYRVNPKTEGFIPYQAMALRYGHPMSGLEEYKDPVYGTVPARSYELRRLEGMWGVSSFTAREPGNEGLSMVQIIQSRAQKLEFYALDGTRILTVVDDPDGDSLLHKYNEGTPNDPATLQAMIIRQKQQIDYMQQAFDAIDKGELTTLDTIPEDLPESGLGSPQRARNARGGITSTSPPGMPPEDDEGGDNPMLVNT